MMNDDIEKYLQIYKIISNGEIIMILLLMGLCLTVLLRPYLHKKYLCTVLGTFTGVAGAVMYLLTESAGNKAYMIIIFLTFGIMYFFEREKPFQKVFLCAVFISFRYLSSALMAEWGFFSLWIEMNVPYLNEQTNLDILVLEFLVGRIFSVVLHGIILFAMVRFFTRIYARSEELSLRELILMLIPTLAPLLEAVVFRGYIEIYSQGIEVGFIKENIPPNFIRFLFYIFSYLAILMIVFLYEQVRKEREENAQKEAFESELMQMRQTIDQTRLMYEQVRILRHDISNHMMTMERLADRKNFGEARKYMSRLKEEYSTSVDGIRCGDPVIDTVLTSKKDIALKQGIDFKCDFIFPEQPVIDVFDLSILLNNALDNALRGASGDRKWISISSISREQFFTIIIKNGFDGDNPKYDADGLPISTKSDEGHGLGMKLIRHIALSYCGEMEFLQNDGEVELRVLLHHKETSK